MITYGYDDLNRLVDEWRKEGENTVYRRQYEYDRVGNRTKLTKTDGENTTVYEYTYNGLGQLAAEYWPYSSPTSRNVYSYDANGNLAQKLEQYGSPGNWGTEYTWTYYWDTQDRLTKVEKYDEAGSEYDVCVEYKYCPSCGGALSERIEYESDRSTVKSWLRYQYHGLNLLRIDEKYDSDEPEGIDSTDQWRVLDWYVHGPGQIGQIVRATAYTYNQNTTNTPCDTMEYYYCYDALGNVNGVLQDGTYYRWEMDAFGNDLAGGNEFLPMTSEGPKEHQTGKMYDGDTGLYYFQARWIDPALGTFIACDPLLTGTVALRDRYAVYSVWRSEGPYVYCANNPVLYVDPTGQYFFNAKWNFIIETFAAAIVPGAGLAQAAAHLGVGVSCLCQWASCMYQQTVFWETVWVPILDHIAERLGQDQPSFAEEVYYRGIPTLPGVLRESYYEGSKRICKPHLEKGIEETLLGAWNFAIARVRIRMTSH